MTTHTASGHEVVPLEGEELDKQMKDNEGYPKGLVRVIPGRWLLPTAYTQFADKIYNFELRSTDVVINTYPKCGTTWMQEIVWTMKNNPNIDNPLSVFPVMIRCPHLDMDMTIADHEFLFDPKKSAAIEAFNLLCPGKNPRDGMMIQFGHHLPDPRTFKTHLPFSLLPPTLLDTSKVIYVARNPKDVIISYLHHNRIMKMHAYVGTLDDFVQYFLDDDLLYGPYWLHLKEAWEKRDNPNLHFVFYEDLKADIKGELKKLDAFLGTKLTDEQLENVAKHTSFKEMKERDAVSGGHQKEVDVMFADIVEKDGGFFRKGETGDWKNKLTPEQSAKVDAWVEKNMGSLGVDFKYTL